MSRRAAPRAAALLTFLLLLLAGQGPAVGAPTAAELRAVEERIVAVAREASPKTVVVRVEVDGEALGFGSGAVVSADGLVLTCAHVTEAGPPSRRLVAVFPDGARADLDVVASNSRNDLSLCRAKGLPGARPAFEVAEGDPKIGDWVVALGHPGGPYADLAPSVAAGKVTGVGREVPIPLGGKEYVGAIQTDVPIFGGNSGGPLVDLSGRLVGINGAILLVGDVSVSVGTGILREDLARLRAGEKVEGRRIEDLGRALLALMKEVDTAELGELFSDERIGNLLRTLGAAAARREDDEEGEARDRAARRLDDIAAAFPYPAAAPRAAVVRSEGRQVALATPWTVDREKALWLTAAHSLPDGGIEIVPPGTAAGSRAAPAPLPAAVRGVDGEYDLALLETAVPVGAPAWGPPARAAPEQAPVGAFALIGGGPGTAPLEAGIVGARARAVGKERRIPTLGIVRLFHPPHTSPLRPYPPMVQVDAPLDGDQFGAPVVRPDGRLVGVAVAHFNRGATMLVPAEVLAGRVERMARREQIPAPPPYGPKPRPVPDRAARDALAAAARVPKVRLYSATLSGAERPALFEQQEGGPTAAEDSGAGGVEVRAGDVLASVGGAATPTVAAARAAIAALAEGAAARVVLRRGGTEVVYEGVAKGAGKARRLLLRPAPR